MQDQCQPVGLVLAVVSGLQLRAMRVGVRGLEPGRDHLPKSGFLQVVQWQGLAGVLAGQLFLDETQGNPGLFEELQVDVGRWRCLQHAIQEVVDLQLSLM